MAWVKSEQSSPANVRAAVYSETRANFQSKTFDITAELGVKYVIRPTLIEILYVATADPGTRTLEVTMLRAAVAVMTLVLGPATHPTAGETKRIFLQPLRNVPANEVGSTGVHFHTLPPIILGQGDLLRIRDSAAIEALDDMTIHIHADVLSR